MPLPEPAEQVRTAPIKVLRAIFAGIGQLLLAADRFREESEDLGLYDPYDPFRPWDHPHVQPTGADSADPADAGRVVGTGSEHEAAGEQAVAGAPRTPPREKPVRKAPAGKTPAEAGAGKTGTAKTRAAKTRAAKTGAGKATAGKRDSAGKADSAANSGTAAKARRSPTTNGDTTTMRVGKARRPRQEVEPRRFRSLDSTGNVRLLSPEDLTEMAAAITEPAAAEQVPATAIPEAGTGQPEPAVADLPEPAFADLPEPAVADQPEPAAASQPEPAVADLPEPAPGLPPESVAAPIAGYETLSLPSLRARLRHLDVAQVRDLLDYEQATARREDVLGMFERRIAKLGATASDAT